MRFNNLIGPSSILIGQPETYGETPFSDELGLQVGDPLTLQLSPAEVSDYRGLHLQPGQVGDAVDSEAGDASHVANAIAEEGDAVDATDAYSANQTGDMVKLAKTAGRVIAKSRDPRTTAKKIGHAIQSSGLPPTSKTRLATATSQAVAGSVRIMSARPAFAQALWGCSFESGTLGVSPMPDTAALQLVNHVARTPPYTPKRFPFTWNSSTATHQLNLETALADANSGPYAVGREIPYAGIIVNASYVELQTPVATKFQANLYYGTGANDYITWEATTVKDNRGICFVLWHGIQANGTPHANPIDLTVSATATGAGKVTVVGAKLAELGFDGKLIQPADAEAQRLVSDMR
jgi:hypothetical protein